MSDQNEITPTERARKSRKRRLEANYTRIDCLINPTVSKFMKSVMARRKFLNRTQMVETLITEEMMRLKEAKKKGN
ncbi:MAG: hypothetical protein ACWGQW_08775 [bacterium]